MPKPPVATIYEKPIEIDSVAQVLDNQKANSAHRLIADAIYDCRRAFHNGQVDFLQSEEIFCFPCATVVFSKKVNDSGYTVKEFGSYLVNTYPKGQPKSYWELIGGTKEILPSTSWEIPVNQDLYITEIADKKGVSWTTAFKVGAAAGTAAGTGGAIGGAFIGGPIGSVVVGGVAAIVAGVVATGGTYIVGQFQDPKFTSYVSIADDKTTLERCNATPPKEQPKQEQKPLTKEEQLLAEGKRDVLKQTKGPG